MAKKFYEVEDTLPEDLWLNILSRLAVESLLCCRCVCKAWHHIIGTNSFVETHLAYQYSSSNKYVFYDSDTCTLFRDFEFPFDDTKQYSKLYYTPQSFGGTANSLSIKGICNGLFCLSASNNNIYLWNPICRKVKKLPQLIIDDDDDGTSVYAMGVSFGYYDDDYKVIVISHGGETYIMCVYSLKTNSWKIIRTNYLFEKLNRVTLPVPSLYVRFTRFVHGTAYMLTCNISGGLNYSVICFSLSDETIRVIKIPEEFSSMLGIINMEIYEDTIAVLGSCARLDSHCLDMWILRSKSCSSTSPWEKKFSIKLEEGDGVRSFYTIPVGFLNNGKYLVRTVVFAEDACSWVTRLSWCDLESPKLTEFKSHTQSVHQHGRRILPDLQARICSNCVESLLLLNEDSLDPFVHTETEATCSSMLFTLHE